jgi:hypothetical protein
MRAATQTARPETVRKDREHQGRPARRGATSPRIGKDAGNSIEGPRAANAGPSVTQPDLTRRRRGVDRTHALRHQASNRAHIR